MGKEDKRFYTNVFKSKDPGKEELRKEYTARWIAIINSKERAKSVTG